MKKFFNQLIEREADISAAREEQKTQLRYISSGVDNNKIGVFRIQHNSIAQWQEEQEQTPTEEFFENRASRMKQKKSIKPKNFKNERLKLFYRQYQEENELSEIEERIDSEQVMLDTDQQPNLLSEEKETCEDMRVIRNEGKYDIARPRRSGLRGK